MRSLARHLGADGFVELLGSRAPRIAGAIPDLKEFIPGVEPLLAREDPGLARFRLFDEFQLFFADVSKTTPLVLVLDDLQWADEASLRLFEFMAAEVSEASVVLLATYRDVEISRLHPLSQTLAALNRERNFHRIQLSGLSMGHAARLFESAADDSRAAPLVDDVITRAEGNPFFLHEFARLFRTAVDIDPKAALPEGVREIVRHRLNRVSEQTNVVLQLAGVVGREFDVSTVTGIAELDETETQNALEEALNAQIIEEAPDSRGRLRFGHALIHQALLDDVSRSWKVRLHARIAEHLENAYSDSSPGRLTELAYHSFEAVSLLGADRAVHFMTLAGAQAKQKFAYEDALGHYQRALELRKGQQIDFETASLFVGLGQTQGAVGQVGEAWSALNRAFDYFFDAGDVLDCVEVAEYPLHFVPGLDQATRMVEKALTLVSPGSHEEGRLLSRYGLLINLETGDYEAASQAFGQAMKIAARENDQALEMWTLAAAVDADWYHLRADEVLKKSERVFELARLTGDKRAEAWPRFSAAYELIAAGNLDGARMHAAEMLAVTEKLRDKSLQAMACAINLSISRIKGDFAEARHHSEKGLALEPRHSALSHLSAILESEAGDLEKGRMFVRTCIEKMEETEPGPAPDYNMAAYTVPAVAYMARTDEWFPIAEAAAEAVFSSGFSTPFTLGTVRLGRAWMAAQRGETEIVRSHYGPLVELRDMCGTGEAMAAAMPTVDRVLGQMALVLGEPESAIEHFELGLTFSRNAGYRPEEAWTCHDLAKTLIDRDDPGDRVKALSLLDDCLELAESIRMGPLVERARSLRQELQSDKSPGNQQTHPAGLTDREVEVLKLVAAGDSNPEIAQQLVLSVNTVLHHISNILGKTGSRNRTEAAMFAAQAGLFRVGE